MSVVLRPYQIRDLDLMRAELRAHRSALYVAPCGSGKGTLISHIVNTCVERGKRVIFAVHGKALVHDMSQRVARLGIKHGVLMGAHRRERWHAVQVASIDTLHRMEHPPQADLIIADECHMSLSPTWRKTIDRYPQSKVIGMTATPIRLDRQGLGSASGGLFDSMVVGPTERELIEMGFLVRSRVLAPPPPSDLGSLKKTAGEFNTKQQAAVCDKAKVIGDIVKHWVQHAEQRHGATAAFGVDQAHANHIAEQFRLAGFEFAYVDAETPDTDRQRIWDDLDHRRIRGVSSVGCLSVGWDHSVVDCIISARKTASLGLWRQMLGRGSRIHPGKENFLCLDHVGNTHQHFPYGMFEDEVPWCLDGEAIRPSEHKADSVTTCKTPAIVDGVKRLPCYATFKTGPKECPYCGLVIMVKARKIEQQDGELKEIKWVSASELQQRERTMKALYEALHRQQRENNYKPGFASIRYKEQYGEWPKRAWKEEMDRKALLEKPEPEWNPDMEEALV